MPTTREIEPRFETSGQSVYQQQMRDKSDKKKRLEELEKLSRGNPISRLELPRIKIPGRSYETYKEQFFSGSNAKVFFGDIWVDDIVTIQYNIRQNKKPVYGFASQNYDALSYGTILGEGSLSIAFKEVGYLNIIKNVIEEQRLNRNRAIQKVNQRLGQNTFDSPRIDTTLSLDLVRQSETIEDVIDNLKTKEVQGFNSDFEEMSELYEDSIWGDVNGNEVGGETPIIERADEFDYKLDSYGNPIGIKYDMNGRYDNVLNILLTFGEISDSETEQTVIMLNDVHFTGQAMVLSPTGDPIGETYQFIFKNINKNIDSKKYTINSHKFSINGNEFTIAKWDELEAVEKELDKPGSGIDVVVMSGLENGNWRPITKKLNTNKLIQLNGIPFMDRVIATVEESLNVIDLELFTGYTKLAIKVNMDGKTFNMLASNVGDVDVVWSITNPTKQRNSSLDLVRREDFFDSKGTLKDARSVDEINLTALLEQQRREQQKQSDRNSTDVPIRKNSANRDRSTFVGGRNKSNEETYNEDLEKNDKRRSELLRSDLDSTSGTITSDKIQQAINASRRVGEKYDEHEYRLVYDSLSPDQKRLLDNEKNEKAKDFIWRRLVFDYYRKQGK